MRGKLLMTIAWFLGFVIDMTIVLFFAKEYTKVIWITVIFTALAFLTQFLLWNRFVSVDKDMQKDFFAYPLIVISTIYLLLQFMICCINAFATKNISVKVGVFLNLFLFLIIWLIIIVIIVSKQQIEKIDRRQKKNYKEL